MFLEKLMNYGLNAKAVKWTENFLNDWAQSVLIRGMKSSWTPVASSVPQKSILGPHLQKRLECRVHPQFADGTKLGEVADMTEDLAAIQRVLEEMI